MSEIRKSRSAAIIKKIIFFGLCSLLLAPCSAVDAQQPAKVPRIGYLVPSSRAAIAARTDAFRQSLRELGYIEGKNILIEYRYAEGNPDLLKELAAELVRLKVDIIVTTSSAPTRAAKQATDAVPIVMAQDNDPVGNGFVANLARPGGNVTGLAALDPELSGKRVEFLKEILPTLSRLAVLGDSTIPGYTKVLKETEVAAASYKVQLKYLDVLDVKDIEAALQAAGKQRADGLLTMTSPVLFSRRSQLAALAIKHGLAAIYHQSQYVEAGGLMSYGASFTDMDRRAATYVDKILKGARAAELPVEQPTKFDLVVNLKAAKQIGLTIPQNVLARARTIIK